MANHHARKLAALLIPGLLLTVVGCGRTVPSGLPAAERARPAAVAAKGVSPDHEATLSGDIRRAKYWQADAELVMAIHSTGANTTKISASANVFYSQEAFLEGKTCVFVARHYGIRPIAQYTESPDYNRLAGRLKPIGAYTVKAEEAWRIAKAFQPVTPAPAPTPGQPQAMHDPAPQPIKSNFMWNSHAFLIQSEGPAAQWNFYTGSKLFTIDAQSKAIAGPVARINPNDRLNAGMDVDLQRASIAWLPTSRGGSNVITAPSGTN